LPSSDFNDWIGGPGHANVTPDGNLLVFTSSGRLTPDTTRTDGAQQVFRYDAQTHELTRISIGEHGFNDNGNGGVGDASIVESITGYRQAGPGRPDPTMSHDGGFVFFMSSVGLTPGALNGVRIGQNINGGPEYAQNIYEYHDGTISLISDGRDVSAVPSEVCVRFSAVCLVGTDATGSNVFFSTADQLAPQDTDTQVDFYDARICTTTDPCIKPPPPSPPPCLGEACHGVPAATPMSPSTPTVTFNGQGNLTSQPSNKSVTKRRVVCGRGKRRHKHKCVKVKPKKHAKRHRKGK
jgi:hypothetical protein